MVYRGNSKPFAKRPKGPAPKGRRVKVLEPHQVIQRTHHEVLQEIQYKYPGLYNLSRKTGHKLLDEIAKIMFDRLKDIMSNHLNTRNNCFKLSGHYRQINPHHGDFPMILSTLHEIQDAHGAPRSQIQETDLLVQPIKPNPIVDVPAASIKKANKKYSEAVLKAITSHINALNTAPTQLDGEEDIARKRVRVEMKKMLPFLPSMVNQIMSKHFMPQQTPLHRIRIYGEPFLPSKEAMSPFVSRYHGSGSRVIRHPRMFNLLMFKIMRDKYDELMAMDGHAINGATLVIRSDLPTYSSSDALREEMAAALGAPRHAPLVQPGTSDYEEDERDFEEL